MSHNRQARPNLRPGRHRQAMLYITGDTHGSYRRLRRFFRDKAAGPEDLLITLGDSGLTYYGDERDAPHKDSAAKLPLPVLCLRGNHDRRPDSIPEFRKESAFGGVVYVEEAYPGILHAVDGEIYHIHGFSVLTVGGAYSIDKQWRLDHGYNWFPDEQLSRGEMRAVEARLDAAGWSVDLMLTHTCPLRHEPRESFFPGIDQTSVDKSMERWLDRIESRLDFKAWYCGHFHVDKQSGPLRFLYADVVALQQEPAFCSSASKGS